MKTSRPPRAASYRNDAVYRSAQQLVSSSARRRKPRRKLSNLIANTPKWIVLTAGIALGISIGWYAWRSGHAASTPPSESSAASSQKFPFRKSRSSSKPAAPAISGASSSPSPHNAPGPVASNETRPRPTLPAHTKKAKTSSAETASPAQSTLLITQLTAEITLRGELRSPTNPPERVELTLRSKADESAGNITGVIRFLNGELRYAANAINGQRTGNLLTLRETGPVWQKGDIAIIGVGRKFTVSFPTEGMTEYSGTWTFGEEHGTLHLTLASPW